MKTILQKNTYDLTSSIDDFLDLYYSLSMRYWASDLLKKGLSPKQINTAVIAAIKIANSSGLEIRKHFRPMFSGTKQDLIQDCKLSLLGYGLVLLNADTNLSIVGTFQVELLERFLQNKF
ncbi:hypothetical protein H2O64_23405 [Kordia sp. YSTF-M3]|uniref:Uncharacterized protein n=1 Tax=Kordia aestuariivivens TaxID=2759037 RepID=A0ABR7QGD2_9FLAO|nr:hypothetical protein [Kordia aestuariivivens]MBC8757635.1 hypothetical protein [Kordia aestuariivivens]